MPPPSEKPSPSRRGRRQDTMPGGWLWMVVLLLLTIVLLITFGFPNYPSIDYSDFRTLLEEKRVAKVILAESGTTLTAELKDTENLKDDNLKKLIRNNTRIEVMLWTGDVTSGEVSKLLDKYKEVPRKTERSFFSPGVATLISIFFWMIIIGAIFFFLILPRFR